MTARAILPAPCDVRPAKPEDLPFVTDSWTKYAYRHMHHGAATRLVRALLSRETSLLCVAHVPGEPDALLGWAAMDGGDPACLHYVYVRRVGRRQGIATRLLASVLHEALEYSHAVPDGVTVPKDWTFNPKRAETTT